MPRRHADLPRLWLMTDPRQGDTLWAALERLPRGAGVVFRHYGAPDRRVLYERVRRIARARRLVLVLAGDVRQAIAWRADGVHGRGRHRVPSRLIHTAPGHERVELIAARGASLVFVSPVFATRSHPGAPSLGRVKLGLLAGHRPRGRNRRARRHEPEPRGEPQAARDRAVGGDRCVFADLASGIRPPDQNLKAVPT